MNKEKFYKLANDRVFKIMFCDQRNKKLLIKLLEKCLNVTVTDLKYLTTEKYTDVVNKKDMRLDCLVETNVGKIEIEMNSFLKGYIRTRNFSYLCKTYSEHYEVTDDYSEDVDVIQINFTNGLGASRPPLKVFYKMAEDGELLVKNMKTYIFNLDYYEQIWENKDIEKINEDYIFLLFNRSEEELNELKDICASSKEFVSMVKEINKKHRGFFTMEEDDLRIHNSLLKEARKEGIEDRNKEIVLNMLKKEMNLELISELTNLSIEEIEKIKNNLL